MEGEGRDRGDFLPGAQLQKKGEKLNEGKRRMAARGKECKWGKKGSNWCGKRDSQSPVVGFSQGCQTFSNTGLGDNINSTNSTP